jgi:hypothetical protein
MRLYIYTLTGKRFADGIGCIESAQVIKPSFIYLVDRFRYMFKAIITFFVLFFFKPVFITFHHQSSRSTEDVRAGANAGSIRSAVFGSIKLAL